MARRKKDSETPTFALMLERMEEEFPGLMRQANQPSRVRKVQTGVFQLDRILGGGLPLNRLNLISGQKASFKTTLALKTVKNFLLSNEGEVVYIDTEHALDERLIARLRLDSSRIHIMAPQYGEQACEYAERFAALPEVACVVVDSLADLNGKDEIEKGYFDSISRGVRARLIARMTRALISIVDADQPKLLIMINHLLPYVDGKNIGEYTPGGKTQIYNSSVVLKLWTTGKTEHRIKFEDFDAENFTVRQKDIGFLVEYSKVSHDNASGEFALYLEDDEGDSIHYGDTNDCSVVFDSYRTLGLLSPSPPFTMYEQKFSSKIALYRYWRSNEEIYTNTKIDLITRLQQKTGGQR